MTTQNPALSPSRSPVGGEAGKLGRIGLADLDVLRSLAERIERLFNNASKVEYTEFGRLTSERCAVEADAVHGAIVELQCARSALADLSPAPVQGDVAGLVEKALKQARKPTHYPDYLDDPEGYERLREFARTHDGHAFTAANNNSVWRLVETIERLQRALAILSALAAPPSPSKADGLHPATSAMVDSFALALKGKLRAAEIKYGHGDSWRADDWQDKCRADLLAHVHKGDPRDVAAYAAFCWAHGWSTTPAPSKADVGALVEACKPFAHVAAFMDRIEASDDLSLSCRPTMQTGAKGWAVCLEVKDFRRAATALASFRASHDGGL